MKLTIERWKRMERDCQALRRDYKRQLAGKNPELVSCPFCRSLREQPCAGLETTDCPWFIFEGIGCCSSVIKRFPSSPVRIGALRLGGNISYEVLTEWRTVRIKMLTHWIKKIRRRICYLQTGK